VIQAVKLRDLPVFVQQEGKRDWLFPQKLFRLENAAAFFGGNVDQRSQRLDPVFVRLQLSHARAAIGSPGASQKLQDQGSAREQRPQSKRSDTIGGGQRELWRLISYRQRFGLVAHPAATVRDAHARDN
jgi:hypothetical protein